MSNVVVMAEDDLHDLLVETLKRGYGLDKLDLVNGIADTIIHDAPVKPVMFNKDYSGFESLADLDRDATEAFDEQYNEGARMIPDGEFDGTVTMVLTYVDS